MWVDFSYLGEEKGTSEEPYRKVGDAVDALMPGGFVNIKGDSSITESAETLRITKTARLSAVGGPVRIGVTEAKSFEVMPILPAGQSVSAQPPEKKIDADDLLLLLQRRSKMRDGGRELFDFTRHWWKTIREKRSRR